MSTGETLPSSKLITFIYISRILIAEAYTDSNHTLAYFGTPEYKIAHFPFNFGFVGLKTIPSPTSFDEAIKYWLMATPAHGVANWVVSKKIFFSFIPAVRITRLILPPPPSLGSIILVKLITWQSIFLTAFYE